MPIPSVEPRSIDAVKIDYTHITPHRSSREGARIHGLVLHTTEGSDHPGGKPPEDLVTLGIIFDGEEASAHVAVNVNGVFGRYVEDNEKAWAVCNFNSVTLSLEQVAFAAYDKETWFKHRHDQLHGAAEFLAYGHTHYGVPLEKGEAANGAIVRPGVFQHRDLGVSGSGHSDCGDGYPEGYVILLGRYFIARRLHARSRHAEELRKALNGIRHHYGIDAIAVPAASHETRLKVRTK